MLSAVVLRVDVPEPFPARVVLKKLCGRGGYTKVEALRFLNEVVIDVLDVCCRTGTIGLCMARYCKEIRGMEIIPQAIEDAKRNAEVNGIKNAHFSTGNADDLIHSMVQQANIEENEEIVAILDPPRAGLTTKAIMQLRNSKKNHETCLCELLTAASCQELCGLVQEIHKENEG
jgi:tRNA/tmRNA/rRNA uracil-C5-methylase (TrmA/RlmC/RlmD family)